MTYSIVALDPASGDLGVGVQTHQPAVGAIVPWISPGIGAVATQAMVNIDLGPRSLALLERGLDAGQALSAVLAADSGAAIRQLAIVDAAGNAAAHTGDETIPCAGHRTGSGYSVQANMMRNDTVPAAMADAFEAATGHLAQRILAALDAAEAEGGDMRGRQSAAILVRPPDPTHVDHTWDLRVDNDPETLRKLRELVDIRRAGQLLDQFEEQAQAARDGDPLPPEQVRALALAAFAQVEALHQSDEQTFWFAVTGLANTLADLDGAAEMLSPLFERAPQWRILLHRLQEPVANADLAARLPLPKD